MATFSFGIDHDITSPDLALGWAILLKDYVQSSSIVFAVSEAENLQELRRTKLIQVQLEGTQTVKGARCVIENELRLSRNDDSLLNVFGPLTCLSISLNDNHTDDDDDPSTRSSDVADQLIQNETDFEFSIHCSWQEKQCRVLCRSGESQCKLFGLSTFEQILERYESIMHQLHSGDQESRLIMDIQTISTGDLAQIWTWNKREPYTSDYSAVDMFIRHIELRPDALAIDAWDGSFTYQDLHELSTTLASQLINKGAKKGHVVPICFEKSKWTAVAALAVIKTGAAFVLIDEDLPRERMIKLFEIIATEIVVVISSMSQEHLISQLASDVLVLGCDLFDDEQVPEESIAHRYPRSTDLLYIVFTSGTTGVPKAVMIDHSNMCFYAKAHGDISVIGAESKVLGLASYAYDVSLGTLFISLLRGACLCVPSAWESKNGVVGIGRAYQVTHAQMAASMSKLLSPADMPKLEMLDVGGEQVTETICAPWRGSRTKIINAYGPSECTVVSVANVDTLEAIRPSIIGRGHSPCWIVDPENLERLCPVGAVGELILEGPLVGAGYLRDPKNTSDRFISSPSWLTNGLSATHPGRSNARLYRTGDLVRYVADGQLEYLGRYDQQVKLRGQRIELGELTAHLTKLLPAGTQFCPQVLSLNQNSEMLVVLVVEAASSSGPSKKRASRFDIPALGKVLKQRLPSALVPGAWAFIPRLPLTLSGKTDHRELKKMATALRTHDLIFSFDH